MHRFVVLCVTILLVSLTVTALATDSRGLSIELRASTAANAPIAQTVQLYSKSYALVIGNDDYTNGWPRLSNAVKDARLVAEALEKRGFLVQFEQDLDAQALKRVMEDFFIDRGADPNARLFVWYAGHGHTERGNGYLVPADGPLPQANTKGFRRKAVSMREIGAMVREADAKHVMAVFDSCFAGTVFEAARAAPPPAITRVTTEPVRQFLTSGDAGQTVSDDGKFRRLFIEALEGKRAADANGDGYLTASELGLHLTDSVSNYTYNKQTPRYGKLRDPDYDRGDFVFRFASVSPSAPKVALPASPTGGGLSFDDLNQQADKLEASKREWGAWQKKMNKDYDKVVAYLGRDVTFDLKKAALERFVKGYETDNPYSDSDESLRQNAKRQLAALVPPKRPKPTSPVRKTGGGNNAGEVFQDCPDCPEMVIVPAGSFRMGDLNGDGESNESPVHTVNIGYSFAVGKYEVTFGEWDACVRDGGCEGGGDAKNKRPAHDEGWGRGSRPVTNVSWNDAQKYVKWLSRKTGKRYRLLSESEWEYVARAGTHTKYHWGNVIGKNNANCDGCGSRWDNARTAPVGSFQPNAFGLHDTLGNVWEWIQDCYVDNYRSVPTDGRAMEKKGSCDRVGRGGGWSISPSEFNSAYRGWLNPKTRFSGIGIRLARDL
ncbi:SUMF1/EgtB/PvdO family nonheme iron enzyme [Magnetovibrio sp. PR-2]|uniref:SUMF1/EgtB/PvdO family nonheme iron enzyme n=1 Tax=Magnetovibrio sp. PR-2 TaxID=3120356 RepID=UPI002FCE125C